MWGWDVYINNLIYTIDGKNICVMYICVMYELEKYINENQDHIKGSIVNI